jgi:phosphopantothenoylcysteine decarboxylase/phosphopantothenate--cysteine ligase
MNQQMWAHEATRANSELLQSRGVRLIGPDSGSQACGETGPGRMVEPASLVEAVMGSDPAVLQGYHVLVSAGPTFEDIDPVRYIGNRSSGRMGFAVAEAARAAGARVSLVAGPVGMDTPEGVERTDVRSANEMREAVLGLAAKADVFISVAAVADYTPASPVAQKITKGLPKQRLELVSTPDIVAEVSALDDGPMTVGFAAETENLREYALGKLSSKGLDMIAANRVGMADSGFESNTNEITLLSPQGEVPLGRGSKRDLARKLVSEVAARLRGNETRETSSNKDTRPASGR